MKQVILFSVAMLLYLSSFAQVEAQQDTVLPKGTISGKVMTAEGTPVTGAEVFVYNIDDIVGSSTSDSAGNYLSNRMFPGTYRVWVKCKGYERTSVDSVKVIEWKDTKLDIPLKPFKQEADMPDTVENVPIKVVPVKR